MVVKNSKQGIEGIVKLTYACAFLRRIDITNIALAGALKHGLNKEDIRDCILMLMPKHCKKTMRPVKRPNENNMAVFHRVFKGVLWYVKITFNTRGRGKKAGVWLVVISFKEK